MAQRVVIVSEFVTSEFTPGSSTGIGQEISQFSDTFRPPRPGLASVREEFSVVFNIGSQTFFNVGHDDPQYAPRLKNSPYVVGNSQSLLRVVEMLERVG